jgi:hypothetical protein
VLYHTACTGRMVAPAEAEGSTVRRSDRAWFSERTWSTTSSMLLLSRFRATCETSALTEVGIGSDCRHNGVVLGCVNVRLPAPARPANQPTDGHSPCHESACNQKTCTASKGKTPTTSSRATWCVVAEDRGRASHRGLPILEACAVSLRCRIIRIGWGIGVGIGSPRRVHLAR